MSSAKTANEQNLEFNFDAPSGKLAHEKPSPLQESSPASKPGGNSYSPRPPSLDSPSPQPKEQPARKVEPHTESLKSPNSFNPSSPMTTTPSFSQFQQNIQRQSREQKAVGSLLSGVVVVIFSAILFVALLAGFGTWVLWRQIQHQSVTVAQLDDKMSTKFKKLVQGLNETTTVVNQLSDEFRAQNLQLTALQSQLTDFKNLERKERTANQAFLKELQQRVAALERREANR